MTKTLESIQMDFNRMIRKANDLEQIAERLGHLAEGSVAETLQTIDRAWSGEASREYLGKGNALKDKLKENASQAKKIAESMRTTARATYNAEKEAILLAQQKG